MPHSSSSCSSSSYLLALVPHRDISLDPHADTGALTPSADWIKYCFSKNFLESF